MQNPIYEEIAKKHGVTAQEVENEMNGALAQIDDAVNLPEFLLALSDAFIENQ